MWEKKARYPRRMTPAARGTKAVEQSSGEEWDEEEQENQKRETGPKIGGRKMWRVATLTTPLSRHRRKHRRTNRPELRSVPKNKEEHRS